MRKPLTPNAFRAVQGKFSCSQFVKPESDVLGKAFRRFVINDFVSVDNEVHPIRILSYLRACCHCLRRHMLVLKCFIQDVELGLVKFPLHAINLKSDLVSGTVVEARS